MVSTFATPRDSLRETLFLLHAPQRRRTAPATPSAETGRHRGLRAMKSPRVTLREVRPNPSLKLSANGVSRWSCGAGASPHFAPPAQRATPLSPA